MSHRKDPNKKVVKNELLKRYGKRCCLCGEKYNVKKLTLHHIIKWVDCHKTDVDNCVILCEKCHELLHYYEMKKPELYEEINLFLSTFKKEGQK